MATFYRIEHKESLIGPYNHFHTYNHPTFGPTNTLFCLYLHEFHGMDVGVSVKRCPTPLGDFSPSLFTLSARFGFSSLTGVKKWFGKSKKKFAVFQECGFVLRKYTVASRFDSSEQSIAKVEEMNVFEDLPFSTLTK